MVLLLTADTVFLLVTEFIDYFNWFDHAYSIVVFVFDVC